ncbi:hypothetical protein [Enterobacter cloacae complex sp. ESBL7]|uniref:hypothetical protein n=1 Tax=Enterobacter cloacae complex sp. ESBL7 TaxID=3163325 RepID=UPI00356B50C4
MANTADIYHLEDQKNARAMVANAITPPHTTEYGSGNGGGGNMEARVAKLEATIEHIASDVTDIKTEARQISTNVSSLKTDVELIKYDIGTLRTKNEEFSNELKELERKIDAIGTSVNSFKTTMKVSASVLSAAIVVFGVIAGPYLEKIVTILNGMALKN